MNLFVLLSIIGLFLLAGCAEIESKSVLVSPEVPPTNPALACDFDLKVYAVEDFAYFSRYIINSHGVKCKYKRASSRDYMFGMAIISTEEDTVLQLSRGTVLREAKNEGENVNN